MHKWKIVIGSLTVVVVLLLLTPQDKLDSANESWSRLWRNPAQLCLDYERSQLKDPDSAKVLSSHTDGNDVTIKYKAKNSYGAFGTTEVTCSVKSGQIDIESTKLVRGSHLADLELQRMDREIACLDNSNKLLMEGSSFRDVRAKMGDCKLTR